MRITSRGQQFGLIAAAVALTASTAWAQVQHGAVDVVELTGDNTPEAVIGTRVGGYGSWTVIGSNGVTGQNTNRGDIALDFGEGEDSAAGVLIVSTYELVREEPSVVGAYYATAASARDSVGDYFVAVSHCPDGYEVNYDVTVGHFPFVDGWLGASAYNSANGGVIDELVGHSSIELRNTFNPGQDNENYFQDAGNGDFKVHLTGIDLRHDGIVLANGAKNEDNYTAILIDDTGDAWLQNRDNGDNNGGHEQDPTAFIFIPSGTENVVMGQVTGSGRKVYTQGDFNIELNGQPSTAGSFILSIPGESPSTGTLLYTPGTRMASDNNDDNMVFIEPEGDHWVVETRDLDTMPLVDFGASNVAFQFAFLKDGVDITPAEEISRPYLAKTDLTVAARFKTTEFTPDNGVGDMRCDRSMGSDALGIIGDNKGDIGVSWLGVHMRSYYNNGLDDVDGIVMGNATEFFRDNFETGGVSGWTTFGFDNSVARTHAVSATGGEINSDFALAFFPRATGFPMDADIHFSSPDGFDAVPFGEDAATNGVLMLTQWNNSDIIVRAEPDGDNFNIYGYAAIGGAQLLEFDYGYVYLPYETPGLVAGHIDAAGNVITGTGNFTVGSGTDPVWGFPYTTINVPGVNPETDGVLLVTPTDGGYAMSWEAGADGFRVAGLDPAMEEADRRAFSFVYVPYESNLQVVQAGDIDADGDIDLDDWAAFADCMGGPGVGEVPGDCLEAEFTKSDLDGDSDVDLQDAAAIMAALSF